MTTSNSRPGSASTRIATMSGSAFATADTTYPTVVSKPVDGQAVDADLIIKFSEAVQAGSGKLTLYDDQGHTVFSQDIGGGGAIRVAGDTLTLHLEQRLAYATQYTIDIESGAIQDLAGNPLTSAGVYRLSFQSSLSPVAVNVTGSSGNDTLHGSDLDDTIDGGAGMDTIYGHGGNDILTGGEETGWSQNDIIEGGDGNDTLYGNGGADRLEGGAGNDKLYGGEGADRLYGEEGDDIVDGGTGDDYLFDTSGNDTLRGGDGNDILTGGNRGLLDGGNGDDSLSGHDGANYSGGAGADMILVEVDSTDGRVSSIAGGDGDDDIGMALYAYTQAKINVSGGAGIDTFAFNRLGTPDSSARIDLTDFAAGAGGDVIDVRALLSYDLNYNPFGESQQLRLVADGTGTLLQYKLPTPGSGYMTVLHIKNVQPGQLTSANFAGGFDPTGSTKGLTLTGTSQNDSLSGTAMDDTISGLGGNDMLWGGGGNDILDGGSGDDTLRGENGDDTLLGGAGNDSLSDDAGDNRLDGGDGDDILSGGHGNDTLNGGAGNDTIQVSHSTYPFVMHTTGIDGGTGNDVIEFSYINSLVANVGGGAGADTFRFTSKPVASTITITDFSAAAGDKLDLLALLPNDLNANPFGTLGYLKAQQSGSDVVIYADTDGAAGSGAPERLLLLKNTSLANLSASAFAGGLDPSGSDKGVQLTGTSGDDKLTGTWLNDTIDGGAGADRIEGGPGADLLIGGDETVLGSGDTIFGGAGNDVIRGGAGADGLYGDGGNDTLEGGSGNDTLDGGADNDTLDGGDGDDWLVASYGSDTLVGGAGNDTLSSTDSYMAGAGDTTLIGGAGDDTISAGRGNDVVDGGTGNDTIIVNFGNFGSGLHVTVGGGDGDDMFRFNTNMYAPAGTVVATGGAGRDTYAFSSYGPFTDALTIKDFKAGTGGDVLDVLSILEGRGLVANPFGASGYLLLVQDGTDTLVQVDLDGAAGIGGFNVLAVLEGVDKNALTGDNFPEGIRPDGSSTGMVISGTAGNDTLRGGLLDDVIHGGDGDDHIDSGHGADILHGDGGSDFLNSSYGNSQLFGDDGDDTLNGAVYIGAGNDTMNGGAGNDRLQVWRGNNTLLGGDGDDQLASNGGGTNLLSGGAGNDWLTSYIGNDTLSGGDGNDNLVVSDRYSNDALTRTVQLDGGAGDDTIELSLSYAGSNSGTVVDASGGSGSDTYVLRVAPSKGSITIADFQGGSGGDLLDLSAFVRFAGTNPFAAGGNVRAVQSGKDTIIEVDLDGTGPWDFRPVVTLKNLDKSTLTVANMWNGFNPDGSSRGQVLTGTEGDDTLNGSFLDDTLTGGAGNDILFGNFGNDVIEGGDGDDYLSGDDGSDTLSGGTGDDKLVTHGGNDILDGGSGNDSIQIWRDADATGNTVNASGGEGNDEFEVSLYGSSTPVRVLLTGGAGSDSYSLPASLNHPGTTITISDFQAGAGGDVLDAFWSGWTGTTPFSSGTFRFKQVDADAVLQFAANGGSVYTNVVTLKSVDWHALTPDNLNGWPADGSTTGRTIVGTDAADKLIGTEVDDTISGGAGDDTISGLGGADVIDGGSGNDTITGGTGRDTLSGGDGDDVISASVDGGIVRGDAGNDSLLAKAGTITLDGGSGDDYLSVVDNSAPHNIRLLGGDGNDTFFVDSWSNAANPIAATGGAGRDVFMVMPDSPYTITDFQAGAGGDQIRLNNLAKATWGGADPLGKPDYLRLVQSGSDTLLQFDWDGARPYGSFLTYLTLKNVQASALTVDNFFEGMDPRPIVVGTTPAPTPTPTPTTPAPAPAPAPGPTPAPTPTTPSPAPSGTSGNDKLTGGNGNDKLDGGDGNDLLTGGAGDDVLVGGSGLDTALYDGKRADYTLSRDASGWHVTDARGSLGHEGVDALQGVERLQFADQNLALDIDGVAGQAYRLYRAAFDRTPDGEGLGFWIGMMDKGTTLEAAAGGFATSKEFNDLYGSAPSNAEIVSRLYQNILHRAPEQGGYEFWVGVLDKQQASLPSVLGSFSESGENQDAVADLIASGILFTPYGG